MADLTSNGRGSMSGWLSKKSKASWFGGSNWKRGFWVLNNQSKTLEEYSNESQDNLVYDIDPKDIQKIRKHDKDKLSLHLVGEDEPLFLLATDEVSRNRWLEAFGEFLFDLTSNDNKTADAKDDSATTTTAPPSSAKGLIKKMSFIATGALDKRKGSVSAFEKKKSLVSVEKKKSVVTFEKKKSVVARKSNLQTDQLQVTAAPQLSPTGRQQNPLLFLGRKSALNQLQAEDKVISDVETFSISEVIDTVAKQTQGRTSNPLSNFRASVRKNRQSGLDQTDLIQSKSFMAKARNFVKSTNKDFVESAKKKGGLYLPTQETERNKQRAAVIPVNAKEEKVDRARFQKTAAQSEMLTDIVLREFAGFFGGNFLKEVDSQSVVDLMFIVEIAKDSTIALQGEATDRMYVIDSGIVGVYTQDFVDRPPELEIERKAGDTFGVLSLIYNQPAPFMIKTHTDCRLWALPSRKFHELTTSETKRRIARKVRLLDRVPLISNNIDMDAVEELAESMEYKDFQREEVVLKRDDLLKQVFVVAEGSAKMFTAGTEEAAIAFAKLQKEKASKVEKEHHDDDTDGEEEGDGVPTLQKGDVFGELALLGREFKSDYTIIAESSTFTILCLEANDVEELVGPLRQYVIERWIQSNAVEQQQQAQLQQQDTQQQELVSEPVPKMTMASRRTTLNSSGSLTRGSLIFASPTAMVRPSLAFISPPTTVKPHLASAGPSAATAKKSTLPLSVDPNPRLGARGLAFKSQDHESGRVSPSTPPSPPHLAPNANGMSFFGKNMIEGGLSKEEEDEAIAQVASEVKNYEDFARKTKAAARARAATHGVTDLQAPSRGSNSSPVTPPTSNTPPLHSSTKLTKALGTIREPKSDDPLRSNDLDDEDDVGSENLDRPFIRATPLRPDMNMDNLKLVALLGSGSFGRVHLTQNENKTDELFALKALTRHYIVLNGWEKMVENERNAMLELSTLVQSPFLLKLFNSFSDSKNIYLLLELCEGGDLYNLIHATRDKKLDENVAKFYFGNVVLGLEAMQCRDIVYRDLKPENLMIDKTGYVKIADFGLAKKTLRTFTVCGTPEYMTPETLMSRGHGLAVDWWAAGILLFEVLHGCTPFAARESVDVYEKILAHKEVDDLVFPDDETVFSPAAKDMIRHLLHPKKNKRLGVKYPGVEAVKAHEFFTGFDWEQLEKLQMSPPIVPNISHIAKLLADSASGKPYDPKLYGAPDDHSGWTLAF